MKKIIYILIGPQGSGKTHWATNLLIAKPFKMVRLSQDEQGRAGHLELFEGCLRQGFSMVVDRMNFDREQRDRYVVPARQHGYHVIFVWFKTDIQTCLLRLATRRGHPTIAHDTNHRSILEKWANKFQQPHYDEFDEILIITGKKKCKTLDLCNLCLNKKIIIVGDIHGCFDEFISLLNECGYRAKDIVISTGDLVDRGPKIEETLCWFRNTPGAYVVEGNHDNKIKRHWLGNPVKVTNGLKDTIEQCADLNPLCWAAWLESLPHMIRLNGHNNEPTYVVHAGVDGRKPIDNQRVETLLYTRYLDGSSFFDEKNGLIWWKTLDGTYTVVSGHIITENIHPRGYVYCLDGGACYGGKLRALIIDHSGYKIHEVDSHVNMSND